MRLLTYSKSMQLLSEMHSIFENEEAVNCQTYTVENRRKCEMLRKELEHLHGRTQGRNMTRHSLIVFMVSYNNIK